MNLDEFVCEACRERLLTMKPKPGDLVLLMEKPLGLLEGLPGEDQKAIAEAIGKPIQLVGYDDDGRS
jgi:hypothetical protein